MVLADAVDVDDVVYGEPGYADKGSSVLFDAGRSTVRYGARARSSRKTTSHGFCTVLVIHVEPLGD